MIVCLPRALESQNMRPLLLLGMVQAIQRHVLPLLQCVGSAFLQKMNGPFWRSAFELLRTFDWLQRRFPHFLDEPVARTWFRKFVSDFKKLPCECSVAIGRYSPLTKCRRFDPSWSCKSCLASTAKLKHQQQQQQTTQFFTGSSHLTVKRP